MIFGIVVGLRIIVPLFIPRFPLPAIIIAMIVDAADQTIFQQYTSLNLDNYQSYDKALDIYYLAIAFLSTMRNWTNQIAFNTSRFLWYYRLIGTAAFEMTQIRALLLIFPNTFEYFFDFYEAVRLRWDPRRLAKRVVIGAAAFIWIFIKLPQEYWIHIAQLDTTDLIKEDLFGVPVETSFSTIIADNVLFFVGIGLILAALILGLRYYGKYKLPSADWKLAFDADAHGRDVSQDQIDAQISSMRGSFLTFELLEKTLGFALIMIIFTRIIPGTASSPLEQTVMIGIFLAANTIVSELVLRRRKRNWGTTIGQFAGTMAINSLIVFAVRLAAPGDRSFHWAAALFFVFLLSVLITFYDRYRPIYLARFGDDRVEKRAARRLGIPSESVR
ncbi:hypothetical protein BH23CHL5_BH23CHL5_13630 [soil metagenome]